MISLTEKTQFWRIKEEIRKRKKNKEINSGIIVKK
jgi:hypothetical protein